MRPHPPGRHLGAALTLTLLLAFAAPAHAHPRSVGVFQAQLTDDGARVLVKLDAPLLFEALALGPPEAYTPAALTQPEARHRALAYLAKHVRLESAQGLCERDAIDLYQLTPSEAYLDVIMSFHCARPRAFLRVTATPLLDGEGHRLKGTFAAGEHVARRSLRQADATFTFTVDDPPPPPPPDPPPPHLPGPWIALGALALLPLAADAPRRQRLLDASTTLAFGLAAALSALAAGVEPHGVPLGVLGLPGATLAALGLILERLPTSPWAQRACWGGGALSAGLLTPAAAGPLVPWAWAAAAASVALAALLTPSPPPPATRRLLGALCVAAALAAAL